MTIIEFIDCDYVKDNTAIEKNTDCSKISPYIIKVQETHIQQIMGSHFYNHICDAIENDSLKPIELTLLRNYVQKAVAEFVFYEALPFLNFKTTDKAVSKESSEYSQPSTLSEIKYLRQSVRDLAEFYLTRTSKFLSDNASKFPEYKNPDSPENLPKKNNSYFNGIYIPRNKKC